jgi:hypothetical protein
VDDDAVALEHALGRAVHVLAARRRAKLEPPSRHGRPRRDARCRDDGEGDGDADVHVARTSRRLCGYAVC